MRRDVAVARLGHRGLQPQPAARRRSSPGSWRAICCPTPTQEQRLATGFNRNHMQSQEGGIVAEEYRTEYVVDRVNTLGRAFLGLSVECARCHDHKYDPISQKEFYRLFGFFNNVNEIGQIPYSGVPSPTVIVTTPMRTRSCAALARADARRSRPGCGPTRRAIDRRIRDAGSRTRPDGGARRRVAQPPGLVAHFPFDRAASGHRAAQGRSEARRQEPVKPKPRQVLARERASQRQGARPRRRQGPADEDGSRQVRRRAAARRRQLHRAPAKKVGVLRAQRAVLGQPAGSASTRPAPPGPLIDALRRRDERQSRLRGACCAPTARSAPACITSRPTTRSRSRRRRRSSSRAPGSHVALTYDGSSRAAGMRPVRRRRSGRRRASSSTTCGAASSTTAGKGQLGRRLPPLRIGRRGTRRSTPSPSTSCASSIASCRRSRWQALAGVGRSARRACCAIPGRDATADAAGRAARALPAPRRSRRTRTRCRALTAFAARRTTLLTSLVEVMTMRERAVPRPTFILARGAYDAPTERGRAGHAGGAGRVPEGPAGQPPRAGPLAARRRRIR